MALHFCHITVLVTDDGHGRPGHGVEVDEARPFPVGRTRPATVLSTRNLFLVLVHSLVLLGRHVNGDVILVLSFRTQDQSTRVNVPRRTRRVKAWCLEYGRQVHEERRLCHWAASMRRRLCALARRGGTSLFTALRIVEGLKLHDTGLHE